MRRSVKETSSPLEVTQPPCLRPLLTRALPVFLVFVSLALAPLSTALAVHHDLAHTEQERHQHSGFDICVWIQVHSTGSHSLDAPAPQTLPHLTTQGIPPCEWIVASDPLPSSGSPRGPPLS